MTELTVEACPFIVAHLQHAILHAKRVMQVYVEVVPRELDVPAVEVPAVEEWNPVLLRAVERSGRTRVGGPACGDAEQRRRERKVRGNLPGQRARCRPAHGLLRDDGRRLDLDE